MAMCNNNWINIIIANISLMWDVCLLCRNGSVIFLYVYVIGLGIIQTIVACVLSICMHCLVK